MEMEELFKKWEKDLMEAVNPATASDVMDVIRGAVVKSAKIWGENAKLLLKEGIYGVVADFSGIYDQKWIDLGCGSGELMLEIGNRNAIGIDVNPVLLHKARQRFLDRGLGVNLSLDSSFVCLEEGRVEIVPNYSESSIKEGKINFVLDDVVKPRVVTKYVNTTGYVDLVTFIYPKTFENELIEYAGGRPEDGREFAHIFAGIMSGKSLLKRKGTFVLGSRIPGSASEESCERYVDILNRKFREFEFKDVKRQKVPEETTTLLGRTDSSGYDLLLIKGLKNY